MEFDDVQNVFGDLLLEVRYGLVLAYYRLGNLRRAQEVAEEAAKNMKLAARYLLRWRVRQPKLGPLGIIPDGENRACFYREEMREEWQRSEGSLLWLKKIMKIAGVGC
ncbi:MAG: hypothetical protein GXY54_04275 [Deltaproteobacteria bacterium]|nr:hypothetical protein [Deltaproteobacteria bacterium]